MRWNTARQFQILPQPSFFGPPKRLNLTPTVCATHYPANGNDDDVHQFVLAAPCHPRIHQVSKAFFKFTERTFCHPPALSLLTFPLFSPPIHFDAITLDLVEYPFRLN